MEENFITFKASVNGLILIIRDEGDFEDVCTHIEKKLLTSGKFFKGASIDVKYRGRKLNKEEEQIIADLLSTKTGAEITSFEEDTTTPEITYKETEKPRDIPQMKIMFFKDLQQGMTRFYQGTVRSGQLVSYEGNLVIIGDVNPGGEVIANGNVVVMGSLRGMVHAGADGNKEAIVAALNLSPTQLRIADVITRSPDTKENRTTLIPELATVKGNMVYIERFLQRDL
jgi:septum site-determining protein MinC